MKKPRWRCSARRRAPAVLPDQIKSLAGDIGLKRIYLVGNKVQSEEDRRFLEANTPGLPVLGCLPYSAQAQEADRLGIPVYDYVDSLEDAKIRLQYDLYYIKHQSLWLDSLILFRTMGHMLTLRGR